MHRLPPVLIATFASLVLAAPAFACENADQVPVKGQLSEARKATLCLLNAERSQRGLRPLRSNTRLRRASKRHSRAMVQKKFFEHTAPTGSTMVGRISRAGYRRWASLGENIAWGTEGLATPRAIVRGWMKSPGHRANILRGSFREIGIGVVAGAPVRLRSGERGATYTTDFGVRH